VAPVYVSRVAQVPVARHRSRIRAAGSRAASPSQRGWKDLGKLVRVLDNWEDTVRGADIVVEAPRLTAPGSSLSRRRR
jgi:hypothetical protein